MPAPIACVDSGIDYLTCTYNSEANLDLLAFLVHRSKRVEIREGNMVHAFGMSGYRGERVGGLEYGTRHDGCIVRLSGFSAQRWWKRFGKLATNCSRIDLQQTMVHDEPWTSTTERHWIEMLNWYTGAQRRPKPHMFHGPEGIETIYSGERVSDIYLRLYHRGSKKGCEAAIGHVRYETEIKAHKSWAMLRALLASSSPQDDIAAQVRVQFEARGCSLDWSQCPSARIRVSVKPSDIRRQLAWMQRSVRPAIERMIELGHRDECLAALGLCRLPDKDTKKT